MNGYGDYNMAQSLQQMLTTRKSLIGWYRDQLAKFLKLGIGKYTEHNTKVSQTLIDTTKKRIVQLGGEDALHPDWGTAKLTSHKVKLKLRERMNENHTNGTASTTRSKSNGNIGHEGDQS